MDPIVISETITTKYKLKDKNIYAVIYWKATNSDLFKIKIFSDNIVWSGRYSIEFAKQFSSSIDEEDEEYCRNVKKSLLNNSDAMFSYDFVEVADDCATFSWKKRYEDAFVVHGSVPVHRDLKESKDFLLEHLYNENITYKEEVDKLKSEVQSINNDLAQHKTELKHFIALKESMEDNLYGKFVMLLNAKKRRISLLEENINELSSAQIDLD